MNKKINNNAVKMKNNILIEILQNPLIILCSLAIGILMGYLTPEFSKRMEIVGRLYFFLLEMSVIPILMTAIISALAQIISKPDFSVFLKKILIALIIYWVFISIVGNLGGIIFQVGVIEGEDRTTLSSLIDLNAQNNSDILEVSLKNSNDIAKKSILHEVLASIVPRNIFKSLVDGNTLALVFFSVLMGISIGVINKLKPTAVVKLMEDLFEVFKTIITWILCALPFALISFVSLQIATTGADILKVMLKFILVFNLLVLIVLIINTIIIWRKSNEGLIHVIRALVEPSIVALVTRNSLAALTVSINSLSTKLPFNKNGVNIVAPLGTVIGRFGNILFYGYAAQFALQLYGVKFSIGQLILCIFLAILCGLASTGSTGIATLSIISVILAPIGVPTEAILVILVVVDSIVDPTRSLLIVHSNLALTATIVGTDMQDHNQHNQSNL